MRGQQLDTGDPMINDVVLAQQRPVRCAAGCSFAAESVTPSTTASVRRRSACGRIPIGALGNRISAVLVDLPVGEPNPVLRLAQISYAMRAHKESGQSVGADALVALSGFAPPTLHALGARAANGLTRRLFNLVVTNVPGPQYPLYAAGARLLEIYPVVPLAEGQAVSIGLTSYNGGVYYGLNADRDAMPDVDVLAALIEESLAELLAASDTMAAHRENGSASVSPVVPGSHRVAASTRRSADATGPGVSSEAESTQHEAPQPGTPPLDVSSEAQAARSATPDELAPPSTASTRGKVVLSRSPSAGGGATPVHGDGAGAQSARSSRGRATAGAARKRSGNRQTGGSSAPQPRRTARPTWARQRSARTTLTPRPTARPVQAPRATTLSLQAPRGTMLPVQARRRTTRPAQTRHRTTRPVQTRHRMVQQRHPTFRRRTTHDGRWRVGRR